MMYLKRQQFSYRVEMIDNASGHGERARDFAPLPFGINVSTL